MRPIVRAEGIISRYRNDKREYLVQCDEEETFYRFPGGSIEFGESAAEAIRREFIEELGISPIVGSLTAVVENHFSYSERQYHQITLFHEAQFENDVPDEFRHREYSDVKMVWRTIHDLESKQVVPDGILDVIMQSKVTVVHIKNGFSNELW